MTEKDHLEWLVEQRCSIQRATLQLLGLLRDQATRLAENAEDLWVAHMLIGVAFSLWRAAFLGDVTLSTEAIATNAETFLETVIRDNAIGYTQDRNAREWTYGYYVNNAKFRLGAMVSRKHAFAKILRRYSVEDMHVGLTAGKPARQLWDETFKALDLALDNVDKLLESIPCHA